MSKDNNPTTDCTLARKRQVEEFFEAALDLAPEERFAFLDRACAGDDELRREVEILLEVHWEQTFPPLPSGALVMALDVAALHPSLQGLSLAPGMQLGRYELLRPLGQGGMGTVFLAHDKRLHRRVAIKFLHAATRQMTERFLAEARTTARCKHENIVVIHDVDEIDGRPYMVLEHLDGEPLRQRLAGLVGNSDTASATPAARRREAQAVTPAMPILSVLELLIPVVRALVCAHAQGIVHRDLKPENVFLCSNGTVKVLDFGIAKALTDAHGLHGTMSPAAHASTLVPERRVVTEQGALLGTLPYMSPEQWGTDEIDERTDLWAVGIMLYEMLAGQHPLVPLSYSKLQKQVPDLDLPMPGIGAAVPGLDKLADIVDGCLRKHKADRIRSAEALLHALEEVRAGSSIGAREAAREDAPAAPPALGEQHDTGPGRGSVPESSMRATIRRRSWPLPLAGLGMAGLVALMLLVFWLRPDIPVGRPNSGRQTGESALSGELAVSSEAATDAGRAAAPLPMDHSAAAAIQPQGQPAVPVASVAEFSIPPFCNTSRGIVLTVRAGSHDGLLQTHRTLCTALLAFDTQAVRCVELPASGIDDGDLLDAAGEAGASLVARLEGDHDLHLLPVEAVAEILSELPTIHAAAVETQQLLPGVLHPLSGVLAGDLRLDKLRTPPVNTDAVGWRLATLAWYLNVLGRNQDAISPRDVRSTMTRCRETDSLADVTCSLAHYVYTQLDPTPPDARRWLAELLAHGPQPFKELAEVEMAEDDCMHEPMRVQATLLRLAARWANDPCRRVALIGTATCLLTRMPGSHPDVRRIAYPDREQNREDGLEFDDLVPETRHTDGSPLASAPHMGARGRKKKKPMECPRRMYAPSMPFLLPRHCGAHIVAAAAAERGQWNMLARNWDQAQRDFYEAWHQGNHPIDLLHWAESLLHLGDSEADCGPWPKQPCVADVIARTLDLRYFDEELLPRATFLRWFATHESANAADIFRLYSDKPVHASVIVDDKRRLAELACAKPKRTECRVYRILTRPKRHGAEEALRRLLFAEDKR